MKGGIWVWPTDQKTQRRTLRKVSRSPQLSTLLKAIAGSSEGLSNPEVSEVLGNDSGWLAIWAVRQLLSLGFVTYKTDLFGEPSRYLITDLGKRAAAIISGQPTPKPQASQATLTPTKPGLNGPSIPRKYARLTARRNIFSPVE